MENNHTISEIKKAKCKMEGAIRKLVVDFQDEYLVNVSEIEMTKHYEGFNYVVDVDIKASIEII